MVHSLHARIRWGFECEVLVLFLAQNMYHTKRPTCRDLFRDGVNITEFFNGLSCFLFFFLESHTRKERKERGQRERERD